MTSPQTMEFILMQEMMNTVIQYMHYSPLVTVMVSMYVFYIVIILDALNRENSTKVPNPELHIIPAEVCCVYSY